MPDIYTATFSTPGMSSSTHETDQNKFCCTFDEVLLNLNTTIRIANAERIADGGSYYIAYHIHFARNDVRRRYSEFESLRLALSRLYPTVLVPPIPEKHSIAQYATKQTRAKEDSHIIEKRKRMLQSFLNRIVSHPILASEHVFHRFLERDTNWSEVLNSPPLSTLPKNPLAASTININGSDPTSPTSSTPLIIGQPVIKPGPLATLKHPDPHFVRAEEFTANFQTLLSGPLTKAQKGLQRRLSENAKDFGELGAVYNGFSLTESNGLAEAIEKVGQAVDISYMALGDLSIGFEEDMAEPLEEYIKYSAIAQRVLKHRTTKHLQLERAGELLEAKRIALERLERAEMESKRLAAALQRETEARDPYSDDESLYPDDELKNSALAGALPKHRSLPQSSTQTQEQDASNNEDTNSVHSAQEPEVPKATQEELPRRASATSGGGGNLLNLLSYTLHGLIDVDPEGSRRSSITKTKEQILGLEGAVESLSNSLELTSAALQRDLDRFQTQKEADIKNSLIDVARRHHEYCLANLEAWEEALAEAEKIPTGDIPCRAFVRNPDVNSTPSNP